MGKGTGGLEPQKPCRMTLLHRRYCDCGEDLENCSKVERRDPALLSKLKAKEKLV